MSALRRYALVLAAAVPLAACSGPPPATDAGNEQTQVGSMGAPAAPVAANQTLPMERPVAMTATDYAGKWVGPEGLVLEVTPTPGGGVTIINRWTLDDKGSFAGSITADGLRFMRGDKTVTARPSDGDATGMKWLAGKRDCLTVTVGSEGYCRR